MNETPEINPDCNNANFGRKHKFSEDEDENVVLDVYLDSMESMLVKYAGLSRININCSVKSGLVSIPIWIDFQGFSSKSKLTCRPKAKRTTIKNKMVEEATGRELGIDGPIKALTSELSQNLSQNSGISGSCPFQQEDKEKQKKKNSPCTPIKEKENKEKEENPQTPSNLLERVERLEKVKEVEKEEKVKECRKVEDIKEAVNERSEFTAEEEKKILKVVEKNERSEFFSIRGGDEVFAEKTEAARAPMNSQFAHGGKRAAECMDGGLEETVEEPEEEKLQLDDEEDGLSQPASPLTPDERYRRDLEEVMKKYDNPYRNKPYFKEAEIRRMVESLEYCASSPVKLFVNNFWWSLYEWCGEDDEYNLPADENGEPIESDDPGLFDMVGRFIRVDDAMKVLRHAWEEVADQVECGFVELEDGRVDITAGEVPDVSLGRLVDWRTTTDPNGHEVFVISLRGFRDIEAEDAHEAKTPSTKEEVKAFHRTNRRFLAAVVNMDDSQLTPIERAVKDFAATFMKLDKYYFVERFMNGRGLPMACSELPGYILKPWTLRLDGLGVETEDFYRILNYRGRPYMDGSDLQKMPSTFSYQEVMRWNDMNGFQSGITEETLRNALSTDF